MIIASLGLTSSEIFVSQTHQDTVILPLKCWGSNDLLIDITSSMLEMSKICSYLGWLQLSTFAKCRFYLFILKLCYYVYYVYYVNCNLLYWPNFYLKLSRTKSKLKATRAIILLQIIATAKSLKVANRMKLRLLVDVFRESKTNCIETNCGRKVWIHDWSETWNSLTREGIRASNSLFAVEAPCTKRGLFSTLDKSIHSKKE